MSALTDEEIFQILRETANVYGFRIEQSADGTVIRALRPDGTVAVQARKRFICAECATTWAGAREDHACPVTP